MNEFSIIKRFFASTHLRSDVNLGIGDDAALVTPPPGHSLAITTDTLVAGVHFAAETPPHAIGYKSLAVNLSDLAAMGATPAWITLALTLPEPNVAWLEAFSAGLFQLAEKYQVSLIGGDTTRGPLAITIQAIGFTPIGYAITRGKAVPGDAIFVTGCLGDAGLGLSTPAHRDKLYYPEPRIDWGIALRDIATAAIDISDGLAADLTHILNSSHVGANINTSFIPLSSTLQTLPRDKAIDLALTSGDDYELCFTVPAAKKALLDEYNKLSPITCIGEITATPGLIIVDEDGNEWHGKSSGYQHF